MMSENNQLIHRHWLNGGTVVTNFTIKNLSMYKKAVELYGDARTVIHQRAFDISGRLVKNHWSLHNMNPGSDLSDFWKVYNKVRKDSIFTSNTTMLTKKITL